MTTLAKIFSRVSGGTTSVSVAEAQKSLSKAAGFGAFSITGGVVNRAVEKHVTKADQSGDGRLDVDEFVSAARNGALGKTLPDWSTFVPQGADSVSQAEVAELVRAKAQEKSALGGVIDADGLGKLAVKLLDDDGDGRISRQEIAELTEDLAKVQ